jgi:Kef-type K+ transport system membrane component KefB
VNALVLLVGLLVLSYIGAFLVGGRSLRGFGLPSGSEYLVLGFLVGPTVLGAVDRSMLTAFDPIADVALGWLAMLLGLDYALVVRRARVSSFIAACVMAVLTAVAIAAAELLVVSRFLALAPAERFLLASGIGAACSETTRHAVRWVIERKRAHGPLSTLLGDVAEADGVVPILATAVLFAQGQSDHLGVAIPELGWAGITLGLGALCGAVAAALLGREFRLHESFGVLIGMSLFGTGLGSRLGLSFLALMFSMGITLAASSRHRDEIAAMVAPTGHAILLPTLVLAGARVDPRGSPTVLLIVGTALVARTAAKLLAGLLLGAAFPPARRAGLSLGLGLLSSGALSIAVGLAFALRFPGRVGDTVLLVVAVTAVFGEFIGPACLGSALARAGEIADATPEPTPSELGEGAVPPS